jgi:hypothetical protein
VNIWNFGLNRLKNDFSIDDPPHRAAVSRARPCSSHGSDAPPARFFSFAAKSFLSNAFAGGRPVHPERGFEFGGSIADPGGNG